MKYSLCPKILTAFLLLTLSAVCIRFYSAIVLWLDGYNTAIESYSFTVIFPAVLILALVAMDKTNTKEGLLMRFGTMIQLLLIISLPPFSLYLALGLPVVFLVVELFVTRVPKVITTPIEKLIVR